MIIDTLISAQPFGREMPLSFIWEKIVAWWNYRGAPELVPARAGLFEGTPIVNDEFIGHVKNGKCQYVRADIERFTKGGVRVKVRGREDKPGEGKEEKEVCFLTTSSVPFAQLMVPLSIPATWLCWRPGSRSRRSTSSRMKCSRKDTTYVNCHRNIESLLTSTTM